MRENRMAMRRSASFRFAIAPCPRPSGSRLSRAGAGWVHHDGPPTAIWFTSCRKMTGCTASYAQRLNRGTKAPAGAPFGVFHAHKKPYLMMGFRGALSLEVARGFIITDVTGTLWATKVDD